MALSDDFTNGLDRRTKETKVFLSRCSSLVDELGGLNNLTYHRRSLVRRAVRMEMAIERQESAPDHDQAKLTQSTNTLLGLFRALGIER